MVKHVFLLIALFALAPPSNAQNKGARELENQIAMAEALMASGKNNEAAASWKAATSMAGQASSTLIEAYCANKHAIVLMRLARYGEALITSERAIRLLADARGVDSETRGMLLVEYRSNLAAIRFKQGRPDLGTAMIEHDLPLVLSWIDRHRGDSAGIKVYASLINSLALMLGHEPASARKRIELLAQALELSEEAHLPTALLKNNLGAAMLDAGRIEEAERLLREAISDPGLAPDNRIVAESNLASILQDRGDKNQAQNIYTDAILKAIQAGRPDFAASILVNRASIAYGRGDWLAAEKDFRQALSLDESMLERSDDASRVSLFAMRFYARQWLVDTLLRAGKVAEAFDLTEESSARNLAAELDSRAERQVGFVRWNDWRKNIPSDTAIIKFFIADWNEIIVFVATSTGIQAAFLPVAQIDLRGNSLRETEASGSPLRDLSINPVAGNSPDPSLKMIRRSTGFDQMVRGYRLYLSAQGLGIQDVQTLDSLRAGLSAALVAPLEALIAGKRRLVLMPDGVLAILPWETLVTRKGTSLVEQFEISYVQSASILEKLMARKYPAEGRPSAVFAQASFRGLIPPKPAVTASAAGADDEPAASMGPYLASRGISQIPPLAGSLEEARSIASLLPKTDLYLAAQTQEMEIKRLSMQNALSGYRIVHFATHGIVLDERPNFSAIVLGRRPLDREDGFLTSAEIAKLSLRAELAVISACETGLGYMWPGEGIAGIARSFMQAGANSVMVSLWSVSDQGTAEFMRSFYELLVSNGYDATRALAEAKRLAIKRGDTSFLWAPFIIYGFSERPDVP